jgi:uncharacterized linocin/CFP29 family protein
MGFDQYHEPPDELPAETRTFARLCASLTEEAEAIGWYEQRLAVEPDSDARAIMRDAQGEEFRHFSMDLARAENVAVCHGFDPGGIAGITQAASHSPIELSDDFDAYPGHVAKGVELLLEAGIDGPYGLALGPACYTGVIETTEHGGYLVFDHLRKILDGPIVRAPGMEGALVLSMRGGDFLFESGQDLSIGYDSHDPETVRLYLEESFSFRVATEEAAVALVNAPTG